MSLVAILGAGPLGGAIAHRLAQRGRFGHVQLIDANAGVAEGKALDIRQSGPVEHCDTRVTAATDVLAAAGASVIVLADEVDAGEWDSERGLALVARLLRAGTDAPFVFAGARQLWLMERTAAELHLATDRVVGSSASALVGAVRTLVGLEIDGTGADVEVVLTGRPPAFVIGWSAATAGGALVTDRVPAHRLLAIGQALSKLWPPGPLSVASATAIIAEGLTFGARRQIQAFTVLDGSPGPRGSAAMLPLALGRGRILGRGPISLSPQERTASGLSWK